MSSGKHGILVLGDDEYYKGYIGSSFKAIKYMLSFNKNDQWRIDKKQECDFIYGLINFIDEKYNEDFTYPVSSSVQVKGDPLMFFINEKWYGVNGLVYITMTKMIEACGWNKEMRELSVFLIPRFTSRKKHILSGILKKIISEKFEREVCIGILDFTRLGRLPRGFDFPFLTAFHTVLSKDDCESRGYFKIVHDYVKENGKDHEYVTKLYQDFKAGFSEVLKELQKKGMNIEARVRSDFKTLIINDTSVGTSVRFVFKIGQNGAREIIEYSRGKQFSFQAKDGESGIIYEQLESDGEWIEIGSFQESFSVSTTGVIELDGKPASFDTGTDLNQPQFDRKRDELLKRDNDIQCACGYVDLLFKFREHCFNIEMDNGYDYSDDVRIYALKLMNSLGKFESPADVYKEMMKLRQEHFNFRDKVAGAQRQLDDRFIHLMDAVENVWKQFGNLCDSERVLDSDCHKLIRCVESANGELVNILSGESKTYGKCERDTDSLLSEFMSRRSDSSEYTRLLEPLPDFAGEYNKGLSNLNGAIRNCLDKNKELGLLLDDLSSGKLKSVELGLVFNEYKNDKGNKAYGYVYKHLESACNRLVEIFAFTKSVEKINSELKESIKEVVRKWAELIFKVLVIDQKGKEEMIKKLENLVDDEDYSVANDNIKWYFDLMMMLYPKKESLDELKEGKEAVYDAIVSHYNTCPIKMENVYIEINEAKRQKDRSVYLAAYWCTKKFCIDVGLNLLFEDDNLNQAYHEHLCSKDLDKLATQFNNFGENRERISDGMEYLKNEVSPSERYKLFRDESMKNWKKNDSWCGIGDAVNEQANLIKSAKKEIEEIKKQSSELLRLTDFDDRGTQLGSCQAYLQRAHFC